MGGASRPLVLAGWRAAAVSAVVVGLDQVSKSTVGGGIAPGDHDAILPGLELVNVRNRGVAFGFLPHGGTLVLALTAAALALLLLYFVRHPERPLVWLPTGLVAGGALGNLVDRARDGAVRDFLKVPLWPAFNLADVAITVGVLALVYVLEGPRRRPAR